MSDTKPVSDRVYEEKTRQCLKCGEPFDSSWAGERVCKQCKGTAGWRNSSGIEAA